MIYFPPPNIEYTPNIDVDLGSIRTASTGSTDANQLFCDIAPGNIGDKIIVFCHAKYPSSTVLLAIENDPSGVDSLTTMGGTSYNPTYGQVSIRSRISNGKEVRVRTYTEDQSKLSSISILTVRIKGNHSPLVENNYYSSTGSFLSGVAPSLTMAQLPFIPNYIYFTVLGKLEGTPYTSADLPTVAIPQNSLGVINTANTSMLIGYAKSTNTSSSLNAAWADNSAVNKVAVITYIQSEQRAIGDTKALNTSSTGQPSTNPHYLMIYPHFAKQAYGYEEIYEFTFRVGNYTGTPDGVLEIGLYDITNGYTNATLCTSVSTNTFVKLTINKIPITPYKLTAGRKYAIAFRSSITNNSPSQTLLINASYAGNFALRRSTLTGSYALSSTWSDAGTTSDSRPAIGASVRYTPAKEYNKIISNPNIINQKLKQPMGAVVLNKSSPLTRNLVFYYATHNETSYATSILYGKLPAKINSTMRPHLGTSFGKGLDFYETALGGRIKGISFGQRSQYVLTGLETEFSVAFWAKWSLQDGVNRSNILLAKGISGSTTQDWLIGGSEYTTATPRPSYRAGGIDFTIPGSVSLNKWYRCVVTKKGTNGAWYINGKLENTTTTFPTYTPNANNRYLVMGQDVTDAKSSFYGIPHSIMIWHRALSPQDVLLDYIDTYSAFIPTVTTNYYSEESLVNDYSINKVDTDNIILAEQTQAILTGKNMAITNSARVRYGTKILEMQNYTPAFTATFNVPPLTDFFSSGMPLGSVTFDVLKKE